MRKITIGLILLASVCVDVPAWAQMDLPFEMYGEKFVVDNTQIIPYYPMTIIELSGGQCETASADGQVYAEITFRGQLLVGYYPEYVMSEVFNIDDWNSEHPHDDQLLYPAFHPDNNHIALTVKVFDPENGGVCQADTTFDLEGNILSINISGSNATETIVMLDINTGEIEVLVEGGNQAEFSPDGRYLMYIDKNEPGTLRSALYDMMTGETTFLADIIPDIELSGMYGAVFSPDGNTIYCEKRDTSSDEYHSQVYAVALDGSRVTQITDFQSVPGEWGVRINSIDISPDGEWAVLGTLAGFRYLLIYELSSGRVFSLLTGEEFSNDLHEVIEYDNQFRERFNIDSGLRQFYSAQGPIYEINDVPYDYDEFHLISPSLVGWHPNGETMVILGQCFGPDLALYYKDFDPEFYKSSPTVVADAAPAVFPTIANYPNPFNPQTTLSFTLPTGGYTEVSVYNLAGQRIRELVATELAPGTHEVVWDGRDMHDMPVSSGVFFSQLKSGDTVVTDRMTLVK